MIRSWQSWRARPNPIGLTYHSSFIPQRPPWSFPGSSWPVLGFMFDILVCSSTLLKCSLESFLWSLSPTWQVTQIAANHCRSCHTASQPNQAFLVLLEYRPEWAAWSREVRPTLLRISAKFEIMLFVSHWLESLHGCRITLSRCRCRQDGPGIETDAKPQTCR